jgi:hypothetical protein
VSVADDWLAFSGNEGDLQLAFGNSQIHHWAMARPASGDKPGIVDLKTERVAKNGGPGIKTMLGHAAAPGPLQGFDFRSVAADSDETSAGLAPAELAA